MRENPQIFGKFRESKTTKYIFQRFENRYRLLYDSVMKVEWSI